MIRNLSREYLISFTIGLMALVGLVIVDGRWPSANADLPEVQMNPEPQSVRVRLLENLAELRVRGKGIQFQKRPLGVIPVNLNGDTEARIRKTKVESKTIWIIQHGTKVNMLHAPALLIAGRDIEIGGIHTPDEVVVWPRPDSDRLDVLASIDLEEYLVGVLPEEMSPSWPLEALKAQAVAARTYALYRRERRESQPFDLESTVADQVYRVRPKQKPSRFLERVRQAINETRGQILVDSKGAPFPTYFHSDCGGGTDAPRTIWRTGEPGRGVADSSCRIRPSGTWKRTIGHAELLSLLEQKMPDFGVAALGGEKKLVKVDLQRSNGSGRVLDLELSFDGGEQYSISAEMLRRIIGYRKIKSAIFNLKLEGKKLVFSGRGNGHGVGMCQYGAKSLADKNHSYVRILSHYFPYANLKNSSSKPVVVAANRSQKTELNARR